MSDITLENPGRAIPLLEQDGYALIRDVLSAEEVDRARAVFDEYLLSDADAENEIEPNALLKKPEMAFMFEERLVQAFIMWLGGTLTYYPNFLARLNRFTDWHVDHGFVPEHLTQTGHLYDANFRHLQCIIYFQDNSPGPGGGLDVRPRSHRWAAGDHFPKYDEFASSYPDTFSIDSRAGDLIVFDGRLMHRATPADGTHKLRKYGVFWSVSRNDPEQIDSYIKFFQKRVEYLRTLNLPAEEIERDRRRYNLMYNVRFPGSYLPNAVEIIEKYRINMAEMPIA
jgi:Phytanoyl-CoA dioxygenase (PhyH)